MQEDINNTNKFNNLQNSIKINEKAIYNTNKNTNNNNKNSYIYHAYLKNRLK